LEIFISKNYLLVGAGRMVSQAGHAPVPGRFLPGGKKFKKSVMSYGGLLLI